MPWCLFSVGLHQQTTSQAYSWISLKFPKLLINPVYHCFGEVSLLNYSFEICFQTSFYRSAWHFTSWTVISITVFHKTLLSSPSIASNFTPASQQYIQNSLILWPTSLTPDHKSNSIKTTLEPEKMLLIFRLCLIYMTFLISGTPHGTWDNARLLLCCNHPSGLAFLPQLPVLPNSEDRCRWQNPDLAPSSWGYLH